MKSHTKLSAMLLIVCSLFSGISWAYHGGHGGWHGGGYHGHSSFGFYLGAPYPYYPYPYYAYPYQYPYYAAPPIITTPPTPPVYIQQSPSVIQQNASGYWYYCNNPSGYYPY
ncbi:MAG: hypothetical protein ACXVA0_24545, partial [Mucilaginibacter sp.]